jgi:ribosomal protein S18 acetylase RimI-like enzyme
MNRLKFSIRQARRDDAPTIALAVAMAIGDEEALRHYCGDDYQEVLTEMARAEGTQYSWQNALISECDCKAAGAIVGYDGALLGPLRKGTFQILLKQTGRIPTIPDETESDEYYLDSVAVMPEFRGCGVGSALITAMRDKAFAEGHQRVGLLVDEDNRRAKTLYTSLGFETVGYRLFFGHRMHHLQTVQSSN